MVFVARKIYSALTVAQKRSLLRLQVLVLLMAVFELIGVASIAPFIALVRDVELGKQAEQLTWIRPLIGNPGNLELIAIMGLFVLALLALASLLSAYTTFRLARFGAEIGTDIADRLYESFMHKPWTFHFSRNTASLTKQISSEAIRMSDLVIQPMLMLNAKIILIVLLTVGLLIFNPEVTALTAVMLGVAYLIIYALVRKKLLSSGERISKSTVERYKLMNEGFGAIKQVIVSQNIGFFIDRFREEGEALARSRANVLVLAQLPRYLLELLVFGGMVGLMIWAAVAGDGITGILPTVSVFGLAGLKILPAMQQVYRSLAQIRGNISAFYALECDLEGLTERIEAEQETQEPLTPVSRLRSIHLEGVSYAYPTSSEKVTDHVSLEIKSNTSVALVGSSGSGKSTLADLILGLIHPAEGRIYINGDPEIRSILSSLQGRIAYVPQEIFLLDDSIENNIVFSDMEKPIDRHKLKEAVRHACLDDFISSLPDSLDTKVGERGVQLSGGQRQRIAIARALYSGPEFIVFDEATSALDTITESKIMNAITSMSGNLTLLIIAHRMNTVRNCDHIILLSRGQIKAQGSYDQLMEESSLFKQLVQQ